MGNSGGIILYTLNKDEFIHYSTNVFEYPELYHEIEKMLLQHQNQLDFEGNTSELLFDYHYGGMGNNVFIRKGKKLNEGNEVFYHTVDDFHYVMFPSVRGVFNSVAHSMKNKEE